MKRLTLLFFAASLWTLALPAYAQNTPNTVLEPPSPRQGYYVSLGLEAGPGFMWDKGQALDTRPVISRLPVLRLGQMLTTRFNLGLRLSFLGGVKDGETRSLAGLQIESGYRVWRTLAVQAGVGAGFARISKDKHLDPDDELRGSYGALYMLGLSYDFFPYKKSLSGGFAISPTVGARFLLSDPIDALAILIGVDFTWWTGLPKNQLDLPPDRAF